MTIKDDKDETTNKEMFTTVCRALSNPIRLRIIEHLKDIDHCVCGEIVDILPLAQSTVSQHLKNLKDAGLIRGEVEGPSTCYCLNRKMFDKFKKMVQVL